MSSSIEVRRLGPQIGAEIRGVDVKALDAAGFDAIYRAWLAHNVVVVPGQELQIEDFLRYSRRFGLVVPHPSKSTRHPEHPEITVLGVNKFGADGQLDMAIYRRGAEGWHTDGAYDEEPFKATQLYALAVPSRGGDTFFASMYAAYEALPPRIKTRLEGRKGAFTYGGRRKATALLNEEDRDWTPVFHPIIRVHPETGRKGLYFDPGKILRIEGLEEKESDALIDELTGLMAAKRMEVFKEAVPRARRIALLTWQRMETAQVKEAEQAARALKIETVLVEVVQNGDYEGAFSTLVAERADALFVVSNPVLNRDRKRIIALAARHRLPAIYEWRESAEDGGLLAYGAKFRELNRRVAAYVDKILKGAKPADLPVEQPTQFEMVINLKTAKALGLTIPLSLLARADEVIQ